MADDSNRIGSSGISAMIKPTVGGGSVQSGSSGGIGLSLAGGGAGGDFIGARGNRVLPADYPIEQLDRKAARGTYLDLLV